jgi:hypothetical protein
MDNRGIITQNLTDLLAYFEADSVEKISHHYRFKELVKRTSDHYHIVISNYALSPHADEIRLIAANMMVEYRYVKDQGMKFLTARKVYPVIARPEDMRV